jgi:CHAT domain-containing protein
MGNYTKAESLYREARKIDKKVLGRGHPSYALFCNNLAELYQKMGNYTKAESLYIEAQNIINTNIDKNFQFLSEKEKELYFKTVSYKFDVFNSFALRRRTENPGITEYIFNNTLRNKGLLLKSTTAMRNAILSSKDTALINTYNKWISLEKEITRLYSTPIAKRYRNPEELETQANSLEKQLVKSSKLFSDFEHTQNINWKDVQSSLKANEIAIEFMHFLYYDKDWTDTTYYCALVVTQKSKYPEMIPLFEEKQLVEIIGKFGGNNYSYINGIYGKNNELNTKLYNLIWAPIDSFLNSLSFGEGLKIFISPDGLLHKISFSAIAKKQNVYLCDIYDIEQKSTTGKITESNGLAQNSLANASLFGGITYDTDSTKQKIWNYLEGTETETQEIDKILKKAGVKVNYYTSKSATEEKFKLMASNSSILHIATHGFFYPDPEEIKKEEEKNIEVGEIVFRGGNRGFGVNSFVENKNPLMRSGLVFAGANDVWSKQNKPDSIDDGVLTAQEVAVINMRKTELVVMSACETGLGDIKGSEGVYGLQRAFKMAGVKYEIMSLWQVPDKETEEFMTAFYKKLIKQKDIKQAFYQTQKEMRAKYDPYFWAAFVLIE